MLFHLKAILSKSKAFSVLELIFIFILLGILSSLVLKYNPFKEKTCNTYLAFALQEFQNELSLSFMHHYLLHQSINPQILHSIFLKHTGKNTPSCALNLDIQHLNIIAINQKQKAIFEITPKNLLQNPKISCFFENPLCSKIHHRFSIQ